ncbi:MAG: aspartate--tRNA ligase [Lachnospiraceae bacterium]|nr:aspartate--tRNA ligase [Lachnospiraceae bacterium]
MAESMTGLKRSSRCALVSENDIGKELTLMGWVQRRRNLGALIFVDLRDISGLIQILFDEDVCGKEAFEKASTLRSEFVIAVTGTLQKRGGAVNNDLTTGALELLAKDIRILSEAETPVFPIEDDINTKEDIRLKYRSLDLRRPVIQRNLILRSKVMQSVRSFLTEEGFLEIETPMLTKSTPEGARDYLVPSRIHHGEFYALPQSPQLFKQLLMVSGYDRYFQIARCFRDEDLRADRQPEFTQIDMELSFVDVDDVLSVNERLLARVFKDAIGLDIELPLQRMPWDEAMDRFGSDKPDTRFGMELIKLDDTVKDSGFSVFSGAVKNGGSVRALNVKGQGDMPRKHLDKLTEDAKGLGAAGLAYIQLKSDGTRKASFEKFLKEGELDAIIDTCGGETGDLILIVSGTLKISREVLGQLRVALGKELGLIDESKFNFLWVVDFPMFEWSDTENRYMAMHHPFTMPYEEDLHLLDDKDSLGKIRSKAYDIVLNGTELGGGSVRIHRADVQEKMFEALGLSDSEAAYRFGFLLTAFKYGVPPHAGLAYGLDRMIMLMTGAQSIRDVIAFPKVKDASDLMCDAPSFVDKKQLEELFIRTVPKELKDQGGTDNEEI